MTVNEPVAWMHKTIPSWVSTFIHPETEPNEWQPLYTYPVSQYKAITNTKIEPTVVSYIHPVKELDEQFKKGFEAGKEEGWKAHKFHHPVKELGYNDIMGTWWETMPNAKSCEGVFEFARAILRKAHEK